MRKSSIRRLVTALSLLVGVALCLTVTTGARAQPVQSCVYNAGGSGCLDFTITNHEEDIGFVEFQVTYTGTGTTKTITGVQAVYMNTDPVLGVPLPPGGTPGGRYAPQGTSITYNAGSAGNRGSFSSSTFLITGLDFSFTAANGGIYRVNGWTTGGGFGLVTVTRTNAPTGNFTCQGAAGGSFNHCHYEVTSAFSTSNPIGNVPEIDGGRLPQILLLLSGLYLVIRRRASDAENAVAVTA